MAPLRTRAMAYEGLNQTAGRPNAILRALEDWHLLKAVRRSTCAVRVAGRMPGRTADGTGQVLYADTGACPPASAADHLRTAAAAMADVALALAERQAAAAVTPRKGPTSGWRRTNRCSATSSMPAVSPRRLRPATATPRPCSRRSRTLRPWPGCSPRSARNCWPEGRAAEAVEKLYAAIRRLPNDLTVQTELGRALWQQGQHAAAVAVLTGVLTVDGHALNALRARGEILADLGEAEKALRDLDRPRRPRWPTVQAARALALATLRKPGAADEEIGEALSEAPDNGQVLLYAARVGELGGDRVMAADLARRAEVAGNPALSPHQLEQARRLQRLGEGVLGEGGNSAA